MAEMIKTRFSYQMTARTIDARPEIARLDRRGRIDFPEK